MAKAKIPAKIKTQVRATFSHCVCCGTWDAKDCGHIISEKRGGAMQAENFVLMCRDCNTALGDANCEFSAFAKPNDGAQAIVMSNRARWIAYANAARLFFKAQDDLKSGKIKDSFRKMPKPYKGQ